LEYYLTAAATADADAMFAVGTLHETGKCGLPQDFGKAKAWYERAADAGQPEATYALGRLHEFGYGHIHADPAAAIMQVR